jgi:hypothetical protein
MNTEQLLLRLVEAGFSISRDAIGQPIISKGNFKWNLSNGIYMETLIEMLIQRGNENEAKTN